MFQPLRGETGRTWIAIEYGITTDNSSLISSDSAAKRADSDEEIMSFDLGPEPFDPLIQGRMPSDEWLDDIQQGLIPGASEPKVMEYDPVTQEMPVRPSLIDTMRQDIKTRVDTSDDAPMSPERAPTPPIGFSYDYMTDEPPVIQRVADAPMHSSPCKDPPKLRVRAVPALLAPRPRSSSVPPTPTTVSRMTKRYMTVREKVTPPISPTHVETDPATPPPVPCPGRGRSRGKWRAQSSKMPGVGTRSKTRHAEAAATQAQTSRASWPEKPDRSLQITRMTRDMRLQDPPEDRFRDSQKTVATFKIDENQNVVRPPAAGFHSHHRDVYVIPPPRDPSEHGSSGVDSPCRSIISDTAP